LKNNTKTDQQFRQANTSRHHIRPLLSFLRVLIRNIRFLQHNLTVLRETAVKLLKSRLTIQTETLYRAT